MISSRRLGERILHARKEKGLTQAKVAEHLGASRPTLVAMEKGDRRPSNDELVRLSGILGTSLHDLLREHRVLAEVSPRFRMGPGRAPDAQAVQDCVKQLQRLATQYVELEDLNGLARSPAPLESISTYRSPGPIDELDPKQSGAHAARTVRNSLDLGDGPAADLVPAFELHAGLRIFHLDLPSSVAEIFIWSDELGGCVALNRKHPPERRRWSLVHAVGHFLRDREIGEVLPTLGHSRKSASEVFAESHALEFLAPSAGVSRHFADHLRAVGRRFNVGDAIAMARTWGVAFQTMLLRLEELGHVPGGTYEGLIASQLRVSDVVKEVPSLPPRMEDDPALLPERYINLAVAAFDDTLISETELADYLHCDRLSARVIRDERTTQRLDGKHLFEVDVGHELLRKNEAS